MHTFERHIRLPALFEQPRTEQLSISVNGWPPTKTRHREDENKDVVTKLIEIEVAPFLVAQMKQGAGCVPQT